MRLVWPEVHVDAAESPCQQTLFSFNNSILSLLLFRQMFGAIKQHSQAASFDVFGIFGYFE